MKVFDIETIFNPESNDNRRLWEAINGQLHAKFIEELNFAKQNGKSLTLRIRMERIED